MFARLARLPLRRRIYTSASATVAQTRFSRVGVAVTAGVAASYFAWRLGSDAHRIALDAEPSSSERPARSASEDKFSHAEMTSSAPAPSQTNEISHPDSTGSTEPSESIQSKKEEPDSGEEPPEERHGGGGGESAFNPETGEINWDCPCLGGMAHGPCGPQFKEAFSCFVFSEQEPKGIDCIEKFQAMQNCFREHPEHYADELTDDDDAEEPAPAAAQANDTNATDHPLGGDAPGSLPQGSVQNNKAERNDSAAATPATAHS